MDLELRHLRVVVAVADAGSIGAAARAMGASNGRILVRHILPNAVAPVLVYTTITIGVLIAAEATLTSGDPASADTPVAHTGAHRRPSPSRRNAPAGDVGPKSSRRRLTGRSRAAIAIISRGRVFVDHSPAGPRPAAGLAGT